MASSRPKKKAKVKAKPKPESNGFLERLAWLMQSQQTDKASLILHEARVQETREHILVRSGRIEELRGVISKEAKDAG